MKTAYVFPGQGSQAPGMGKGLHETHDAARRRFDEAREVLGFDLAQVMFEGSDEDLRKTSVTQPAIYVHSVIVAELLQASKDATVAAGHSLGEFSALAAMGALSFGEGLRLVAIRANAMQKACDLAPSTMAAIVGLDDAVVESLCAEVPTELGVVVPANYNSPGQLVISGSQAGVAAAIELAKAKGAKLAKGLAVNGAFHSPFMAPARAELAAAIATAQINPPAAPVVQNVDAQPCTDPERIRENLVSQLTSAVRWTQSVQAMAAMGATRYVELGPGKVLAGLVKRIDKNLEAESRDSV